uniref:Uncharacterized protein n=1 Tax=Arundo donax TaxID=35708 RepID=A0A0A9EBT6_ARUDO
MYQSSVQLYGNKHINSYTQSEQFGSTQN